ncbi:MAG: SDR family oxidoreductase [Bryobacterales bacterium]|nr:SDR family oxidoreductase [Bryobacterales bacterium]
MAGQCVLVTGAGRGVGKRLALGFANAGARLALLARSKPELDLAKLEIEHAGGMALRLRCDVRDYEQIAAAVERTRSNLGVVDVLVTAAGIQGPIGPLADVKPKAWAETIEINLIGVMNSIRAVLPDMIKRRSGKIIVLSGSGAAFARPNFSAYAAAKAALVRMVESVALEVRDDNVQINCMGPGGVYTHMTDEILQAGERAGSKEIETAEEIRRTGGVPFEQQMELALFLASPRSNHITGKFLHVNDTWKRLEKANMHPEAFTLRRVLKVGRGAPVTE